MKSFTIHLTRYIMGSYNVEYRAFTLKAESVEDALERALGYVESGWTVSTVEEQR
jgi:hypothetical protein